MQGHLGRNNLSDPGQLYAESPLDERWVAQTEQNREHPLTRQVNLG